jgi:hypothetical protein
MNPAVGQHDLQIVKVNLRIKSRLLDRHAAEKIGENRIRGGADRRSQLESLFVKNTPEGIERDAPFHVGKQVSLVHPHDARHVPKIQHDPFPT